MTEDEKIELMKKGAWGNYVASMFFEGMIAERIYDEETCRRLMQEAKENEIALVKSYSIITKELSKGYYCFHEWQPLDGDKAQFFMCFSCGILGKEKVIRQMQIIPDEDENTLWDKMPSSAQRLAAAIRRIIRDRNPARKGKEVRGKKPRKNTTIENRQMRTLQ